MQEAILGALQDIRTPFWDVTFVLATALGEEFFVLAVAALIYWNISKRSGYILVLAYLASMTANNLLQLIVQARHPHEVLTGVYALSVTTVEGFSFPSAHTQGATTLFVTLALLFRRNAMYLLTAAVLALVGVSRVYLGVDWPLDVLGGWLIGAFFAVAAYLTLWAKSGPLSPDGRRHGDVTALLVSAAAVLSVVTLSFALLTSLVASSLQSTGMVRVGGAGVGALLGFALERRTVGFAVAAPRSRKIARYLIGMLAAGILIVGVFAAGYPVDTLVYAAVGAWVTGVYPATAARLGLFGRAEGRPEGRNSGDA
jgi:undecaprenyl-diphosphatase